MGQAIGQCALADGAFGIRAALESKGHEAIGRDYGTVLGRPIASALRVVADERLAISQGDVLIDFTVPEATVAHAQLAQELRKPMVIGTTGFSEDHMKKLRAVAKTIPIVLSPNMSVGVNVLFELAQLAAQHLGPDYDVEVVEAHHHQKKDAPSGTAKRLAQAAGEGRGRSAADIPVHALRAGDIVGDHTVIFAGPSERLELVHRAHSRDAFAVGALRAARFAHGRRAGLYSMVDVLKQAVRPGVARVSRAATRSRTQR